jgi:hypothetical protein
MLNPGRGRMPSLLLGSHVRIRIQVRAGSTLYVSLHCEKSRKRQCKPYLLSATSWYLGVSVQKRAMSAAIGVRLYFKYCWSVPKHFKRVLTGRRFRS